MKIYYDDDADIKIIQNLNVTIVGYGSLRCHETSRMPCLCAHENSTLITDLG